MRRRILAFLMTLALTAGVLTVPGAALGSASDDHADKLASLNLFRGTGDGYALEAAPSRMQGLIMLIRLLGLEEDALACTDPNPFTDVSGTGDRYAAYAYAHGLTKGTGAATFTPARALSAGNYVTFLLRALGYDDAKGDFAPSQPLTTAERVGMVTSRAAAGLSGSAMDRGDLVDLSYAALTCELKDGSQTLAEKLRDSGIFTTKAGEAAGVLGRGAGWTFDSDTAPVQPAQPAQSAAGAIVHEQKTLAGVTANVLTVDTKLAAVKTAMVDNTLGHTAPFASIVEGSGAAAVINGNFFASYSDFKIPVGHVMVDGQFLYGNSGITSLGITADGEVRVGRPALFTRVKAPNAEWTAYEVNTPGQDGSVLYTPAYGASVAIRNGGSVMTVSGGTITDFQSVAAGTTLAIPADGFLVYMDSAFTSTSYFRTPAPGTSVTTEYYLQREDPEGFTMDGLVSVVSGAPRLVQDGSIVTALEQGFQEERFTTAVSPRTAIGVNGAGKLVLVSTPAASIQQMRELMLGLGCLDAFNLDGGASCGMYYNGAYLARPGRELTVTLQVFPK